MAAYTRVVGIMNSNPEQTGENMQQSEKQPEPGLVKAHLVMDAKAQQGFSMLLQRGVRVIFTRGQSIMDLVCSQYGIPQDYLDNRIQTIFLDGKAVDQPETRMLSDGCTLSMAAAMPGLAGATLRKGGVLGGFRSGITHSEDCEAQDACQAGMTLKLFNLLIPEIGPVILGKGIVLDRPGLEEFMGRLPQGFWSLCRKAGADGAEMTPQEFSSLGWLPQSKEALVSVEFE
jgi:hypothetical protein